MERRNFIRLMGCGTAVQAFHLSSCNRTKGSEPRTSQAESSRPMQRPTVSAPLAIEVPASIFFPELSSKKSHPLLVIAKIELLPPINADRSVRISFSDNRTMTLTGNASSVGAATLRATLQQLRIKLFVAYVIDASIKAAKLPVRAAELLVTQQYLDTVPVAAAADLLNRVLMKVSRRSTVSKIEFVSGRGEFSVI